MQVRGSWGATIASGSRGGKGIAMVAPPLRDGHDGLINAGVSWQGCSTYIGYALSTVNELDCSSLEDAMALTSLPAPCMCESLRKP
jgi:hypothetical protein